MNKEQMNKEQRKKGEKRKNYAVNTLAQFYLIPDISR